MAGVGMAPKSFHSGECKQDRHHSPAVYCVAFGHLPFMGGSIQDIGEVIKATTETYPAQARLEATQVALTVARQVMAVGITSFESLHARKWIQEKVNQESCLWQKWICVVTNASISSQAVQQSITQPFGWATIQVGRSSFCSLLCMCWCWFFFFKFAVQQSLECFPRPSMGTSQRWPTEWDESPNFFSLGVRDSVWRLGCLAWRPDAEWADPGLVDLLKKFLVKGQVPNQSPKPRPGDC